MTEPNLKNIIKEIFSNYPGRLSLMMGYLKTIEDTLFPEMNKTFDSNSNLGVSDLCFPDFYWVRQAHCFLSRYQEALDVSRKEIGRKKEDIIQKLSSGMIDGYEKRISGFKSRLAGYCIKGEELWQKLANEGLEEGNLEKLFLCGANKKLYQEERREIENNLLNHPYLFFDVDKDSEGVDNSLIQFTKTWRKYYHPINHDYLELHKRLLPENID